jgi:hypothetical protein
MLARFALSMGKGGGVRFGPAIRPYCNKRTTGPSKPKEATDANSKSRRCPDLLDEKAARAED